MKNQKGSQDKEELQERQKKLMFKNKAILSIAFSFLIFLPSFSVENSTPLEVTTQTEVLNESVDEAINKTSTTIDEKSNKLKTPRVKDLEEMTPNANNDIKKQVLNDTESNINFTVKKFLFAMFGVIISSFLIFGILIFMKKTFKGQDFASAKNDSKTSLEEYNSDGSEIGALKTFFDKTIN